MTTANSNGGGNILLGAVLIIGAMMYMRRGVAQPVTTVKAGGSLPGSVGSGTSQVAAGAVAGFLQSLVSGSRNNTATGYWQKLYDPNYLTYQAQSEIAWDAKTPDVYVPGSVSTTGEDQIWTVG